MCFMQEIMYYLLFSSRKNHFLVQIYIYIYGFVYPKTEVGTISSRIHTRNTD